MKIIPYIYLNKFRKNDIIDVKNYILYQSLNMISNNYYNKIDIIYNSLHQNQTYYKCKIKDKTIECYKLTSYINIKGDDYKIIGINNYIPEYFHNIIIYYEMIPNKVIIF